MKKLLSMLAAVSLTATAASSVVACGSSNSSKKDDDSNLIISSNGIKVTSDGMLDEMLKKGDWTKVFGDQGTAIKNFMNYFAEAFMKSVSDKAPELKDGSLAASYTNDDTFKTISDNWKSRNTNASDSWNKEIEDAKENYGKKWKNKLFDNLKNQFGDDVYKNGKTVKADSYTDYETQFKSNAILSGAGSGDSSSIFSSLTDNIFQWAKTPSNKSIESIVGTLKSKLFLSKDLKNKGIDFTSANVSGPLSKFSDSDRKNSLFGQMDNLLTSVKKAGTDAKGTDSDLLDFVVDMYNITGGLDAKSKDTDSSFNVASINWATRKNVFDKINDVTTASNELVKRMDSMYDQDFGDNAKSGTIATPDHLVINPNYNFSDKISYIPDDKQTNSDGAAIAGLYSNTQRFAANDYYNVEKPVAVSEIVVSPIQSSTIDYSQQITNSGYVGTDIAQTDQLYSFIGNFINKNIDSSAFGKANTDDVIDGTPNYTWDDLMSNISGTWDKNVKTGASDWDTTFKGKVKFNAHSNLLTMDSSTSDYSNLLKYSVYDYLSNTAGKTEYKFDSSTAPTLDKNETSIDVINQANSNPSIDKSTISNEYNAITNFVHSMNRQDADGKTMYQVVNSKQGIISFIDSDGIHFVRIEGFDLLNDSNKEKLLGDQTPLSTKDFSSDDQSKANLAKANYDSAMTIKNDVSSENAYIKDATVKVTSDYSGKAQEASTLIGVKYDDLNKGFGNEYLRFLANSSIPKSAGFASPKYSYDLYDLLKSYVSGDITTDSVLNNSSMIMMAWNYAKMILNIDNDDDMFKWVVNGSSLNESLKETSWSEYNKSRFVNDYQKYITEKILSKYDDSNRLTKAEASFTKGLEDADNEINETTWKEDNKVMNQLHPSLKWSKVINKGTSAQSYNAELKALNDSKKWLPFKDADAPSPAKQIQIEAFKYEMDLNQFVLNDDVLKGDEE